MQQGSTATRESAVDLIRQYQKQETHPILSAKFSIIKGEEDILYQSQKKASKRKNTMER